MGLLDSLAGLTQYGGKLGEAGAVAQAFGGKSAMDNFIQNEIPLLYDQAKQATTSDGFAKFHQDLVSKAAAAGLDPSAVEKLMDPFLQPLMQGAQASEIQKFGASLGPQTTQQQIHGAMGPDVPSEPGATSTLPAGPLLPTTSVTTPGQPPDVQGIAKLLSGLVGAGAKVPVNQMGEMFQVPGKMDYQNAQTSNEQTKNSLERGKYNVLESLPNIGIGDTGVSPKALGYTGGLGGYMESQQPARPTARDALIPSEIAKNQAETIKAQRPERPTPNTYRDAGDHTDIINPEGQIIGTLPKNAPPTPKMSDKEVLDRRDLANKNMNSTVRYSVTGLLLPQTEAYNGYKATFDAMDQEAKDRGLIPSTSPAPTPPPGRGNVLKPKGANAGQPSQAEQRLRDKFKINK